MLKLKPGNVFQKLNKMDKKQAYTWGAIVIVCFVALITLASFMGNANESSFEGMDARGYDLAQMPFVNDEAEQYLLASKYPDMQGNNSTMLYSSAEKEARQEADAEAAAEEGAADGGENFDESGDMSGAVSGGGYAGGGYSGGGAGGSGPTAVGQLGSASMGRSGGSGMSGTWGAPRGDFSPYKTQEKGSELPPQFKNNDAKRALSQFAQTSRAAAGLKDGKGGNAKKALMGGNIKGSDAFTEGGVDLSKSGGLSLDTNAPTSTADLGNLDKAVDDAANKGKDDKDKLDDAFRQSLGDKLLEQFLSGVVDMGMQALGGLFNQGVDAISGAVSANSASRGMDKDASSRILNSKWGNLDDADKELYAKTRGLSVSELNQSFSKNPDMLMSDDWASFKTPATTVASRPQASDYQRTETVALSAEQQAEYTALGVKAPETEVQVVGDIDKFNKAKSDYNNSAAVKKRNAEINDSFRSSVKEVRKSNDGASLAYTKKVEEARDAAWNSKQRAADTKKFTPSTSRSSSESSSGGTSNYKKPNDFTTQTQYTDYVDNLDVDDDVKETLRNRKRN